LLLLLLLAPTAVVSAPVTPPSYDMPNGQIGRFTYFDESYNGNGNTAQADAPLSGGLGDLTDGIVTNARWFDAEPGP
jgi:hypothetical protein